MNGRFLAGLLAILLVIPLGASGAVPLGEAILEEGARLYRQEEYEAAAALLEELRVRGAAPPAAVFLLGMSRKQLRQYPEAAAALRAAATSSPRIREAVLELAEVLYLMGGGSNLHEAMDWLALAEARQISPARSAFLQGLVLRKFDRGEEALQAFELARSRDPGLGQAVEVQFGLGRLRNREYEAATERFRAAVLHDPQSDLARLARRYQDLADQRQSAAKSLQVTLGLFGQYDSNVVLAPNDSTLMPATDEESLAASASLRLDFTPTLSAPWLFSLQYALSGSLHDNHSSSHDTLTNALTLLPGYSFGHSSLGLLASGAHTLLKGPGYDQYLGQVRVGPLYRYLLGDRQLLEFFTGYGLKEFYQAALDPEEDRDASGLVASLGWVWLFREHGSLNLRYEYAREEASGDNWDNHGHRLSAGCTLPLAETLSLQLGLQGLWQDYDDEHTVFGVKRDDEVYSGSLGIAWQYRPKWRFIAQVSRTDARSNLAIYDYDRDLFTLGVEYRF